jgi:hypothetical protein
MNKYFVSLPKDEKDNFRIPFGRYVKEYKLLGRMVSAHEITELYCDSERGNQNQKRKGAKFLTRETAHMSISILYSAITTSKGT